MKIKDLPIESRPREKAKLYGIESLNDIELLAIIIAKGVKNKSALEISQSLINEYTNIFCLSKARCSTLKNEYGLSEITSIKLEAIFEFFNRLNQPKYKNREKIDSSNDIYKKYYYLSEQSNELLVVLMLDIKHQVVKEKIMYKGNSSFMEINIREIAVELLQTNTKYYFLVHNHPNNNQFPSYDDIETTLLIKEAIDPLGLILLDHVIVFQNGYFSFKEANILNRKYADEFIKNNFHS